jgi:hypothetical protein
MMFLVQSPVKYKNNINCLLKHLVSLLDVHIVFFPPYHCGCLVYIECGFLTHTHTRTLSEVHFVCMGLFFLL